MYLQTAIALLAASGASATAVLAQRAPAQLVGRDVTQGWSLQSGSAPTDAHSCGNGAYCPISLHCNAMVNNHQVAACCSSSSDCRGEVEGAPVCADSSWNLWVGYDGNGFCCEAGLVGVYDISKSVAGTCVSSDNVGSLRPAVLTSTGTGAAQTLASLSASFSSSTASAAAETTAESTVAPATTTSADKTTATGSSPTKAATSGKSSSTSTAASSTASSSETSTSSPLPSSNGAERIGMGLSVVGAAFLAVAAL